MRDDLCALSHFQRRAGKRSRNGDARHGEGESENHSVRSVGFGKEREGLELGDEMLFMPNARQ